MEQTEMTNVQYHDIVQRFILEHPDKSILSVMTIALICELARNEFVGMNSKLTDVFDRDKNIGSWEIVINRI